MQATESVIQTFSRLGRFLSQFQDGNRSDAHDLVTINERYFASFNKLIEEEHIYNPWFTPDSIRLALQGISMMLEKTVMEKWLTGYPLSPRSTDQVKTIGLVLAGNIPLVGFHDLMCVIISGHTALAKPSSKDDRLIRKLAEVMISMEDTLKRRIRFTEGTLKGIDAVIATGSNNSFRYFEYYFREFPTLIRKNRNGVAVLTGNESEEELAELGRDIFSFFGLGCRNVTKLYIPRSYDLKILLGVLDRYQDLYQHHKYGNNVDYYRTIYLMNQVPILDNGVLILKEDQAMGSPVGVVFYERYSEIGWVQDQLTARREEIQCCISIDPEIQDAFPPGTSQLPMPWDYADGTDTIRFLIELC